MLNKIGRANICKLVVYGSDQTHSCVQKGAHIAGIHPKNFRAIATSKSNAFSLPVESLRSTILADIEAGLVPFFLCATVGTTTSTAVDPVGLLCHVAKDYNIWVHVDAAYAGRLVAKDKRFEIVVPRTFSMVCFRLLPPIPLVEMTSDVGDSRDQIVTIHEARVNELNMKLLESINDSGEASLTHGVVGGVYIIRFVVGATLTEERHVNMAWKAVQGHADALVPCDVINNTDKGVSRVHAEVVIDSMTSLDPLQRRSTSFTTNFRIKDCSKYGTFLNKKSRSKTKFGEYPNMEAPVKDGDLISFGTGNATYRFCFVPLVFFVRNSKANHMEHSLQEDVSSIGAGITHSWKEECTHVLVDESMPVKEDLLDAIVAQKNLLFLKVG
ncbi:hypothetical protein IFM89_007558 [Coptis chinensis]|uniref:tyrosine decarboxylase n=1 Tax=Coptis chinensis TaxID=261450 RepID=A0A835I1W1_9MAGN|nr:hypothetical protein IFM89_007558 [Coptis chinensis]